MSALATAFRQQAASCAALGSPFMERLLNLLAADWPEDTELARKAAAYQGDIGPAGHSVPLRIAGGLHALKLQGDAALTAIYPPNSPDDATFRACILAALRAHDQMLCQWIDSPPQTNEIRRSAALIPAAHRVAARFGLPVWLSELGASGGLNLMWDHYALETPEARIGAEDAVVTLRPDWSGAAPRGHDVLIANRRGVDLSPLDPTQPDDLLRLTAYLWADQPHRLEMTRAAAGAVPAPVDRGDAIEWLERRLAMAPNGHLHIVQNTVAWQYFPAASAARGHALFDAAGALATDARPLAWIQLETDGDTTGLGGAALTAQVWPSGEILQLGRADFHGRWVTWTAD